jgi:hypothetical protein
MKTTFAKAYGIKMKCYWELFGKHVWNLGTWEPPSPSKNTIKKNRKQNLHGKSCVQVESEQWIVHSPHQTQLENTLREHIKNQGNILGTSWELEGNMLGRNKGKMKKKSSPREKSLPIELTFLKNK